MSRKYQDYTDIEEEDELNEEQFIADFFADISKDWVFDGNTRKGILQALIKSEYDADFVFEEARAGKFGQFKKRKNTKKPNKSKPATDTAESNSVNIKGKQELQILTTKDNPLPVSVEKPKPGKFKIPCPPPRGTRYVQKECDVIKDNNQSVNITKRSILLQHRANGNSSYSIPPDNKERVIITAKFEPQKDSILTDSGVYLTIRENTTKVVTFVHYDLINSDGISENFEKCTVKRKYSLDDPCRVVLFKKSLGIVISGFVSPLDNFQNAIVSEVTVNGRSVDVAYPGSVVELKFSSNDHNFNAFWDVEHPMKLVSRFLAKVPNHNIAALRFEFNEKPILCSIERNEDDDFGIVNLSVGMPISFNPKMREFNVFQAFGDEKEFVGIGHVVEILV